MVAIHRSHADIHKLLLLNQQQARGCLLHIRLIDRTLWYILRLDENVRTALSVDIPAIVQIFSEQESNCLNQYYTL